MDKKRAIKYLLLTYIFSGIILLLSSCTHKEILKDIDASYVVTTYDASINIKHFQTYYMSDTVFFVSKQGSLIDSVSMVLIQKINERMTELNYTRITDYDPTILPDLRISAAVINKTDILTDVWYPYIDGWGVNSNWEKWISSTPATNGTDSIAVQLTPDNYFVEYNYIDSTLVSNDLITFLANPEGTTGDLTYKFFVEDESFHDSTSMGGSEFILEYSKFPTFGKKIKVSVQLYEDDILKASDEVSIIGILNDTASSISFLTNAKHTIPADMQGNINEDEYPAAGGFFKIFPSNVDYKFSIYTTSHLSINIDETTGEYEVIGMDADVGTATFQITKGTDRIAEASYTIYKSKKDKVGAKGYYSVNIWNPLYEKTYPINTLIIELANPKNKIIAENNYVTPIIWRAGIYGAFPNKISLQDTTLVKMMIDTAFFNFPYLKNFTK